MLQLQQLLYESAQCVLDIIYLITLFILLIGFISLATKFSRNK